MDLLQQSPLKRVRKVMKIANKQLESDDKSSSKRRTSIVLGYGLKDIVDYNDDDFDTETNVSTEYEIFKSADRDYKLNPKDKFML